MPFRTYYIGVIAIDPCRWCSGTGGTGDDVTCDRCDGTGETVREVTWIATLAHNLAVAGFGALMFKAGDNFAWHMAGDDFSQCTCQWEPGRGEPYRPSSRCEQEGEDEDYDDRYGPERACSCGPCFRDADDIGFPCDSCGGIVQ